MPRSERCRIRGIALTLLLATLGGKRLRPAERVALIEPLPPEERLALVELPPRQAAHRAGASRRPGLSPSGDRWRVWASRCYGQTNRLLWRLWAREAAFGDASGRTGVT